MGHWQPLWRAIELASDILDVEIFVGTIPEPDGPGVMGVHVKLRHDESRWYPGSIAKFPPRARVFRYDGAWRQLR